MTVRTVGIVGAGPSGIMAALEAARCGARALLFDTNAMVGRKLLVTGNGRCNISNANASAESYTCADPTFLSMALSRFGHQDTTARLSELGILTYATPDGWCYPLSDSAATVAEALTTALGIAGVEVHLKTKISALRPARGRILLVTDDPSHGWAVDRVVVATGGKAYPALGSKGDFFPALEALGHTVVPVFPALVPILADVRRLHKLQGVRMDVGLSLYEGESLLAEDVGNVMFTQTGLSGPVAMNLSHHISTRPQAKLRLSVDLIRVHRPRLEDLIARKRGQPVPVRVLLGAVMPAKVPPVGMGLAGLSLDVTLDTMSPNALETLLEVLSGVSLQVTGTRGFQHAQLSTGGISVTEVEPETMASRIVPGLHLAGEVMDVVGPCGGHNLQFAFTSGALAGAAAAS